MTSVEDSDDWSPREIVRALKRIEENSARVEKKIDGFGGVFVPREVHDQQLMTIREAHHDLAKWVTDIAASLERTARDLSEAEATGAEQHAELREAMVTRKFMYGAAGLLVALLTAAGTIATAVIH